MTREIRGSLVLLGLFLLTSAALAGGPRGRGAPLRIPPSTKPASTQSSGYDATIDGQTVVMRPFGATLKVPLKWVDPPHRANNIFLTRAQLDATQPGGNEWDSQYAAVMNELFPFKDVAMHAGSEPFGPGAVSFADLQMRVYFVDTASAAIQESVAKEGAAFVAKFSTEVVAATSEFEGGWQRATLGYHLRLGDYGARANVEVFSKKFDKKTAVIVFLYGTHTRREEAAIPDIIKSFEWKS